MEYGKNRFFNICEAYQRQCKGKQDSIAIDARRYRSINESINESIDSSRKMSESSMKKYGKGISESESDIETDNFDFEGDEPNPEYPRDIWTIECGKIVDDEEEAIDETKYSGIYYTEGEAIQAAEEACRHYLNIGLEPVIRVMAGEYETETGDIYGEPYEIYAVDRDNVTSNLKESCCEEETKTRSRKNPKMNPKRFKAIQKTLIEKKK